MPAIGFPLSTCPPPPHGRDSEIRHLLDTGEVRVRAVADGRIILRVKTDRDLSSFALDCTCRPAEVADGME